MISPCSRFVVFIAALLLFAGQLVSIVHATEHPFHDSSQICASFISLEQHDIAFATIALAVDFPRYGDEIAAGPRPQVYALPLYSSQARAPPLTT